MKRALWLGAALVVGTLALSQEAQADRSPSPGYAGKTVYAYGTVTYSNEWFRGGLPAYMKVAGDGSTILRVTVYDENYNEIDSDTGYTCVLRWNPTWTGPFHIVVKNLGSRSNHFVATTN